MIELPLLATLTELRPRGAVLLRLLGDPTRRRIFLALFAGETCNCELTVDLGLSQNLISHHIRKLREAGFVRERRDEHDARWIHYSIDAETYRAAWDEIVAGLNPDRLAARTPVCPPPEPGS